MPDLILTATTGRETGSSDSRRLRHQGRVPAIIYGLGESPLSVSVNSRDLRRVLTTDAGVNALIDLEVDGAGTFATVIKDFQRHPVRRDVMHIDFLRIDRTKPIEVEIPIHLVGEAKEVNAAGGLTELRLNALKILVRADEIPDSIEVDITDMTMDMIIHVSDLTLADGVTVVTDESEAVVSAELTRAALGPEDEEAEAEGVGEEAEGDAEASAEGDDAE
ncbi:MAG: 50S ribosomal protein L25 [Acidimicrobiales bacterium]